MTFFIITCAAMIAAALLWIILPLLRAPQADDAAATRKERRISSVLIAILIPALTAVMYAALSNWDWKAREQEATQAADMDKVLQQLEAKLAARPEDVTGWLLLGKSYTAMGQYPRAVHAFQQAYDHSKGENIEAVIGLGEALTLSDETSLNGRAGQLFDAALAKAPNHPKALWYGSIAALRAGDLRKGRDRLQLLLAQNPPEQLRSVLERQIQDLDQQLGEAQQGVQASAPAASGAEGTASQRSIRVAVSLAPQIKEQLKSVLPLFILARDPSGGPPLAVQRHSSSALPLTVQLTERDAMIASRSIATVPRVVVVARLSKSGTPQAQSGDFYGEADYEFAAAGGTLNLVIDRTVP